MLLLKSVVLKFTKMTTKQIISLAQAMQATALLKKNVSLAKKKKASTKDFVKMGAGNIVGIELLKAQANLTSGL